MVTPSSIFSQYKQKQPASKLHWLFLWYFLFCDILWILVYSHFRLHAPEYHIHQNHDQQNDRHRYPKSHINSQEFCCSKQIHPDFCPVHQNLLLLKQLSIVTYIRFFQAGCKHHIKQDTWNQICKIRNRKRYKSQHCSKWCKWNNGECGNTA